MNVVKEDMERVGVVEAVEAKGEGEREDLFWRPLKGAARRRRRFYSGL